MWLDPASERAQGPCELSALHWSRDQVWPYQRCSSVTLTQTSFLADPKHSQPAWRTLEWLPNTEGHPPQAEIFWQPVGASPHSHMAPGRAEMSPCSQWGSAICWERRTARAPTLVENDGRGGRPLCWGQGGSTQGQGKAEKDCWLPREKQRIAGCWEEERRKEDMPQNRRNHLERKRGQLQTALWWKRQLTGRRGGGDSGLGEMCPPLRERRGKSPNCEAGDKNQGSVHQNTWSPLVRQMDPRGGWGESNWECKTDPKLVFQWSNLARDENTPCRVRVQWQKSGNKIQKWEAFGRRKDTNRTNMASMLTRNRRKLATMRWGKGRNLLLCAANTCKHTGEWKVIIYIIHQDKVNF